MGRRNLTAEQTAYIIKQEYEAQQKTNGGTGANQYTKKEQVDPTGQAAKTDTRSVVAKAHGVSEHFVQNSVAFGRGLDAADEVSPGIKEAVLSGEVNAPKSMIAEIFLKRKRPPVNYLTQLFPSITTRSYFSIVLLSIFTT